MKPPAHAHKEYRHASHEAGVGDPSAATGASKAQESPADLVGGAARALGDAPIDSGEVFDLLADEVPVVAVVPAAEFKGRRRETPDVEAPPTPAATTAFHGEPVDWRQEAASAKRNLREAGISMAEEVRAEIAPPGWGWTALCDEEVTLSFLSSGLVSQDELRSNTGLDEKAFGAAIEGLSQKGLVETAGSGIKATALGEAIIQGRLTQLDRDSAVAVGAGRIFGASMALGSGSLDGRAFAQTIATVVNRGQDVERRMALLHVAAIACEEVAGRLEPGVCVPTHLNDLAVCLRWSVPPSLRPVAEGDIRRIQSAQAVVDHWARIEALKDSGEAAVRRCLAEPGTYQEVFEAAHGSKASMTSASMIGYRALEEMGRVEPRDAAKIAKAVVAAYGQTGALASEPLRLQQALELMSPVVAVKAIMAEPGCEPFAEGLRSSKNEALVVAGRIARPVLVECHYESEVALNHLDAFITQLGHSLTDRDRENLRDSLGSIRAADEAVSALTAVVRHAKSPEEVEEAVRALAQAVADSEAGASRANASAVSDQLARDEASFGSDQERFKALIRVMTMLANGADTEDLLRAHHAANLLASHPLVDEEEREDAASLAATTKTILVAVTETMPTLEGRNAVAASARAQGAGTPNDYISALRGYLVPGSASDAANMPWPATIEDANLLAYKEMARMGELRSVLTMNSISKSWSHRVIRDRIEGRPEPMVQSDGFVVPILPVDERGTPVDVADELVVRKLVRRLNEHEVLNAYGVFVVMTVDGIMLGKPLLEEDDLDQAMSLATVVARNGMGQVRIVRLGDEPQEALVDTVKSTMRAASVPFTVVEYSEHDLATLGAA